MSQHQQSSPQPAFHLLPTASILSSPPLCALAGLVIILAAVVLAYLPALNGDFLLDDDGLLTANPLIKAPDGLYSFWCTTKSQDYWPVTNTSLWIEWRLWGMNPAGYHVTSLILHIAASLLIWISLRKLSIPGAFLAALIFAVHPVNVESVAWISQRKGLLAMVFFLLSMLCYLKFELPSLHCPPSTAHRLLFYWLSLLAFLLAMLSKGSVAILPVLLLGIIWWLRRLNKWNMMLTAPFFLISAALTLVNLWFQTHGTNIVIREANFFQRLLGAGGVIWFYLYKALLPLNLVFVYPQWNIQIGNILWWLPLLSAVITTAVLWHYRQGWGRPLLFAWGFFCVSLAPVLGFTDVGFMKYALVADHYQYIALIAVIALTAAGWSAWRTCKLGRLYLPANLAAIVAVCMLVLLTWLQSAQYRDKITLYQATMQKNPDSCWIHYNLAVALTDKERLDEAIGHYRQAVRLKPDYYEAFYNLGNVMIAAGRAQEAAEYYQQALLLKSHSTEARNNLANTLIILGRIQEAIEQYRQIVLQHPRSAEYHNNLAAAFSEIGLYDQASEFYQQALRLKPDYAEAYFGLAEVFAKTDLSVDAVAAAQKALDIAHAKGQTDFAKQIEDWLSAYKAKHTNGAHPPLSDNP